MKWLIRRVVKKGKGALQYEEDEHYGDELSVGRAGNQAIFVPDLRVALEHVRVRALPGGKKYRVESLIAAGVRINGHIEQAATVGAGSHLELGGTRVTFIDAPEGFEAAVEVAPIDKSEQAAIVEADRLPSTLLETGLSKRRPSWLLFAFFLITCLLVPLATHFIPAIGTPLRGTPLSTQIWSSGELAAAHHYFERDCQQCHEKGFVSVRDDKCLTCHAETKAHADPKKFALFELADADCAFCHRDHNGKDGMIPPNQSLCSDCHNNIKARTNNVSTLAAVGDFGTQHPQFHVNLPAWDAQGKFTPQRVSMDDKLTEVSGLKYPHNKHVGLVDGLNSPNGKRTLTCASCHTPEPGGARMQPVDFEAMCQDCHRLSFDRLAGDRQVRHANVPEVLAQLSEYYAKRALDGDYEEAAAPPVVRRRRIPGQANAAISADEKRVALSWARDKANLVTRTLFEGKACGVCHTVTKQASNDEGMLVYTVAPVRVAGAWYAKSEFTHGKHETMRCLDCHDAEKSSTSANVLIPGIANCRACHAGEGATGKLASECVDCHGFHQSTFPLHLREQVRGGKAHGLALPGKSAQQFQPNPLLLPDTHPPTASAIAPANHSASAQRSP
jgi:hypothetical protein